ncbi:MAG: hypothetical protein AB7O62_07550 [Pirellulales bacterium]
MVIRFHCPNGHVLTSPDELAGKRGKCPDCGITLQIPGPDETATGEAAPTEPVPAQDDTIVFLCPNGHRLHGSRKLEGKAGQCPHCGARFRVPSHDDPPDDDDDAPSQILDGESPLAGELAVQDVPPSGIGVDQQFNFNFQEPAGQSVTVTESGKDERGSAVFNIKLDSSVGSASHPLCDLFLRLWEERSRGAFVELHLSDGAVIVPERFSKDQSRRSHGLFAIKEPDGTHTLTVVAWESITRICVRRVAKLPKRMFD